MINSKILAINLALLSSCFLTQVTYADTPLLTEETAATDNSTPADSNKQPDTKMLEGGVHKRDFLSGESPQHQDGQTATLDAIRALAVDKLRQHLNLTAEEFRSLRAGCVGYESNRTFFQPVAKVSVVYADSPAYKAGLRKGDQLLSKDKDPEAEADPSLPLTAVICGQEGDPVTITVLRHGQEVKLTMNRMNIEDIKEAKYRHQWEELIRELGYPKEGSFIGTDSHNLKRRIPGDPDSESEANIP
ncbi:MAG TPA: PDZ domain-containing protein [Oculatellaceae cyanobacterium]